MKGLHITITGAQATVTDTTLLTSGMVGLPVSFTFDESWEGLEKTAVFRAGGRTVSCPALEETTLIPWEILERSGCTLQIGVYGSGDNGTLAIPTVWVSAGTVQPGADPEADPGMEPALPMWKQNRLIAEQAMAVAESVRTDADAGLFQGPQGPMGPAPVRGVDYWTPEDQALVRSYVDEAILGGAW